MHKPTKARLHELFEHDADAGVLIWRTRPADHFATVWGWRRWNSRYAGTVAGALDKGKGYRRIYIDGKSWWEHRMVWIYANGDIPGGMQIDHINGNRSDNRVVNLRLVTHAENGRNQSMPRTNTSGVIGVRWSKRDSKWQAKIKIDGRSKHLGYFDTLEAAIAARAEAEREFGFHKGHGKPALAEEAPK